MLWARRLLAAAALIVAAPFIGLGGYLAWGHLIDSPRYADRYFAGLVDVDEVLASRKWHGGAHPEGGRAYGCSFAIVRTGDRAPDLPVARYSREWQMIWGGDWRRTPVAAEYEGRDILEACAHLWPEALAGELIAARDTPGAYAARRSFETLYLYAPEQRLAAVVRYGD